MVNVKDSTPLWSICWEPYPRKRSQSRRITLEHWSLPITALKMQPWGSAPTISCLVDNLAFWLMWHLVWLHAPSQSQTQLNLSKSWENRPSGLMKKQKPFRQKRPKGISAIMIEKARAVVLEVGDMVLVCVTPFKGHHKMQDRWENREYVVEKWPYPNLPVYVVCPRDGEGCSWTLHRNYLLPINSNMGQDETDRSEERVKKKHLSNSSIICE